MTILEAIQLLAALEAAGTGLMKLIAEVRKDGRSEFSPVEVKQIHDLATLKNASTSKDFDLVGFLKAAEP